MMVKADAVLCEIIVTLHSFFDDYQKVSLWLSTPNPQFGMTVPLVLIRMGRGRKVLKVIENLLDGNLP